MEKKEVKKWQDDEALRRYRMIAPLLEAEMDEGKRQQIREETAEKNGISKRTLYRYEKGQHGDRVLPWGGPDQGTSDGDRVICIQSASYTSGNDGKYPGDVKASGCAGKEI